LQSKTKSQSPEAESFFLCAYFYLLLNAPVQ
jgi:hypothetical protein